jgi:hypothetical protein
MAELRQDWSFPDVPEQAATVATVSPTLERISAGFVILGALGWKDLQMAVPQFLTIWSIRLRHADALTSTE